MGFEFDLREFRKAMDVYGRATKKDEAEILNRGGLVAVVGGKGVKGAMQRTPRATASEINAISEKKIRGFVVRQAKRKGEWPLKSEEINRRVKRERARRRSSVAYTAGPGWHNAAVAFGGRGVKRQKGFAKSKASKGSGKRAKPGSLVAIVENAAPVAAEIGATALQGGLNDTARDMIEFGKKKMSGTARRHSAK